MLERLLKVTDPQQELPILVMGFGLPGIKFERTTEFGFCCQPIEAVAQNVS
jgi:hypothetical protein